MRRKNFFARILIALILISIGGSSVFAIQNDEYAADGVVSATIEAYKYKHGYIEKTKVSTMYIEFKDKKIVKISFKGGEASKFVKGVLRNPEAKKLIGKEANLAIVDSITSATLTGQPGNKKYSINFRDSLEEILKKAPAYEEETPIAEIDRIELSVVVPETNGEPGLATPKTDYCRVTENGWNPGDFVFKPNTEYVFTAKIIAENGRKFADQVNCTVNGSEATINWKTPEIVEISYKFPSTLPNMYEITTEAVNGTITESGSVEEGKDKKITYSPDDDYEISKIFIDGNEVEITDENKGSFTFINVDRAHSIRVEYQQKPQESSSEPQESSSEPQESSSEPQESSSEPQESSSEPQESSSEPQESSSEPQESSSEPQESSSEPQEEQPGLHEEELKPKEKKDDLQEKRIQIQKEKHTKQKVQSESKELKSSEAPKTSDESNMVLHMSILGLFTILSVAAVLKKRIIR